MTAGWAQVNSVQDGGAAASYPGRRPVPGRQRGADAGAVRGCSGTGSRVGHPIPPAAATLGFEFIDADVEAGTIQVAFAATEAFTNPAGIVLGAFLAAMLFDTVGPALLATLEPDRSSRPFSLNVSFLWPVRPGRLLGKGRVVHRRGHGVPGSVAAGRRCGGRRHRHRPGDPAESGTGRGLTPVDGGHGASGPRPHRSSSSDADSTKEQPPMAKIAEHVDVAGRVHLDPRTTRTILYLDGHRVFDWLADGTGDPASFVLRASAARCSTR